MAIIAEIIMILCVGIGISLMIVVAASMIKKVFTSVTNTLENEDTVTIKKSEYSELKNTINELREQLNHSMSMSGHFTAPTKRRRNVKAIEK